MILFNLGILLNKNCDIVPPLIMIARFPNPLGNYILENANPFGGVFAVQISKFANPRFKEETTGSISYKRMKQERFDLIFHLKDTRYRIKHLILFEYCFLFRMIG